MKKIYFILAFCFIALLYKCNKRYEEDPLTMKFVKFDKRIFGEWNIQKILINRDDHTHLIYDDTLQIFSNYLFKEDPYNNNYGLLELRTYNNSISTNGTFTIAKEYTVISFGADAKFTLGAINNFGYSEWKIEKLTKKEMHLFTIYDSKEYELFFKKVKK